jgi:competence ComEA-like helix-hairpin-helix protein
MERLLAGRQDSEHKLFARTYPAQGGKGGFFMLSLTKEERQVVLFLLSTALIGLGVDFYFKLYAKNKTIANFTQNIGKVDLNTADKDLLMSVAGIGDKLAQRIIEYRKKQPFREEEELKNIEGFTKYRYEKIKDFFTVR